MEIQSDQIDDSFADEPTDNPQYGDQGYAGDFADELQSAIEGYDEEAEAARDLEALRSGAAINELADHSDAHADGIEALVAYPAI